MSSAGVIVRFVVGIVLLLGAVKFARSTTSLTGGGGVTSLQQAIATAASLDRNHRLSTVVNGPSRSTISFGGPFKDFRDFRSGNGWRKSTIDNSPGVRRAARPTSATIGDVGGMDELAEQMTRDADDVENAADPTTKRVYDGALGVLAQKMFAWLSGHTRELNGIAEHLGLPPETIQLLDAAFTQLMYEQRRGLARVKYLAEAFFYACDVKRVRDRDPNETDEVAEKFQWLLTKLGVAGEGDAWKRVRESDVAQQLKSVVASIQKPVNPAFSVTIPLMKNAIFTAVPDAKDPLQNLKKRFARKFGQDQVESFRRETDPDKVTENHLNVLGKMIPDIFAYVYNHIELVSALRKHESHDLRDVLAITRMRWFLREFTEVFVKRYFEFSGEIDETLLEAINPLMDFLDPVSASEKPEYSIVNFYDETDDGKFEKHMWDVTENALGGLLAVFGNESVEEWKKSRSITVEHPSVEFDKQAILDLMDDNTQEAYHVLGTFIGDFAKGIDLYNEYNRLSLESLVTHC